MHGPPDRGDDKTMAQITLDHIRHAYMPDPGAESDYALKKVDHVWQDGGAYALLGPSGCGKTTLLNIISGLLHPSEGRIVFDRQDVTDLPPEARNIAQVFQFPVVYDTMTVFDNIAFPLRNRGVPEAEVNRRVTETVKMLDMEATAHKKARGLTADVKQKVSLGRGMVRSDVNAILFDEPLTVIDPHMKWALRSQLKLLHKQFGHTMVYVTHDQTEALTFADKVVVMHEGQIVQIGTPEDLFERPGHTFVGYFIGSPGMNFFDVAAAEARVAIGAKSVPVPAGITLPANRRIELGIRPEYVRLDDDGMPIRISQVEDIGREKIIRATLEGFDICLLAGEDDPIPADAKIRFAPEGVNFYADSWRVVPEA